MSFRNVLRFIVLSLSLPLAASSSASLGLSAVFGGGSRRGKGSGGWFKSASSSSSRSSFSVVPRPLGIVYRTYTVLRAADRLQRGAVRVASRLPTAVMNAGIDATKGFVSTTAIMTPVMVASHFKDRSLGLKHLLTSSVREASEYGKHRACSAGCETFLNGLNGAKSRWNRYIASGLTSGFFTYKDNKGPFRSVKSFFTAATISFGSDQLRIPLSNAISGGGKRGAWSMF